MRNFLSIYKSCLFALKFEAILSTSPKFRNIFYLNAISSHNKLIFDQFKVKNSLFTDKIIINPSYVNLIAHIYENQL